MAWVNCLGKTALKVLARAEEPSEPPLAKDLSKLPQVLNQINFFGAAEPAVERLARQAVHSLITCATMAWREASRGSRPHLKGEDGSMDIRGRGHRGPLKTESKPSNSKQEKTQTQGLPAPNPGFSSNQDRPSKHLAYLVETVEFCWPSASSRKKEAAPLSLSFRTLSVLVSVGGGMAKGPLPPRI